MPINPVALIAGALSFSAALAWNKAISDKMTSVMKENSSLTQAIVITIFIIIIVYGINKGIKIYTNFTNTTLKDSTIKAGGSDESRLKLFNT